MALRRRTLLMLRSLGRFRAAAASAAALGVAGYSASSSTNCISKPDGLTKQRTADYTLAAHYHGKRSVRVLRVRRQESGLETVQEYNVQTRLFSPEYSKTFTHEDNSGLVATDTQKNTVYVVAQRTDATTPEAYGADLCRHLLIEYPLLSAVEVDVTESLEVLLLGGAVSGEDVRRRGRDATNRRALVRLAQRPSRVKGLVHQPEFFQTFNLGRALHPIAAPVRVAPASFQGLDLRLVRE